MSVKCEDCAHFTQKIKVEVSEFQGCFHELLLNICTLRCKDNQLVIPSMDRECVLFVKVEGKKCQ